MYSDSIIFLFLSLCRVSIEVQSLAQLPNEENNDVPYSEADIRDKINNIFTNLRVRTKPTLQDDNIIHNFFVSMTLKDYNNLKEIERLSRVYDLNEGRNFSPEINDIFNAKDESKVMIDDNNVTVYTDLFINKLRHLKKIYHLQNTMSSKISPEILHHVNNKKSIMETNETILSDNPFWIPKVGRRLYHGHKVDIKHFPFMASISKYDNFLCAGTIIKINAVITSASCYDPEPNTPWQHVGIPGHDVVIRVGSRSVDTDGYSLLVSDLYRHPRYNPTTLMHNVALFIIYNNQLNDVINPSNNSLVKRILLDSRPTPLSDHRAKILVVGWGSKSNEDYKSHGLAYSVLNLYPKRSCQNYYSKRHVTRYNFCGSLLPKKGGACQHDIGGPAIVNGKLAGIISFASPDCGNSPTVFTRIGYYSEWMKDVLGPKSAYLFEAPTIEKDIVRNKPVSTAKDNGFLDVYRGFQNFVSDIIFSRAQDTASKEDVTNGTNVINILN